MKPPYIAIISFFIFSFTFGAFMNAQEEKTFPKRTDKPFIGKEDQAKYTEAKNAHKGTGSLSYMDLINAKEFSSPILFIHRGIMNPKSSIGEHVHRNMEEMYFVFDGPAEFTVNGRTSELPAGSMALCPRNSSHGIYNKSDKIVQWMNVGVGMEKGKYDSVEYGDDLSNKKLESPAPFSWTQIDRSLLHPVANAHQGKGEILFRRMWWNNNFQTNWYFVDHCLLPPNTSIGYHQHNTIEEIYYILSGKGRSTVNDSTFAVSAGNAVPCRAGDSHGIFNDSKDYLEIIVVCVATEKGLDKYGKEWGDDLSNRTISK